MNNKTVISVILAMTMASSGLAFGQGNSGHNDRGNDNRGRVEQPQRGGPPDRHDDRRPDNRGPDRHDDRLLCVALMAVREGATIELPHDEFELSRGDQLLFAGRSDAERSQHILMSDASMAAYALEGRIEADSWVWRTIERVRNR